MTEEIVNYVNLAEETNKHVSSSTFNGKYNLMEMDHSPPKPVPVVSRRKKLLIIDINGLLADIVSPAPPREYRADIYIARRDVSHCTQTGVKTLENKHKDLVCKELKRIWEIGDPSLPWAKGYYDESNTLLLDDSRYKALLNPPHSAIFPHSFQYHHRRDNSLGPRGDIRVYLEELYAAEDVQKYVEAHPFGQSAINESDSSWEFYNKILTAPQLPLIWEPSVQSENEGKTIVVESLNQVNQNGGETAVQSLDRVIQKRRVDRDHIIVIYDPAWYV